MHSPFAGTASTAPKQATKSLSPPAASSMFDLAAVADLDDRFLGGLADRADVVGVGDVTVGPPSKMSR